MSNIISQTISTIKNWWLFLLSGVLLIAGSVYVLYTPEDSYITLAWLFSILVLVNGVTNTYFSISNRKYIEGWGWYLAGGIFEIFIGLILVNYPGISIVLLPLFVGTWLLFKGINLIGTSLDLKKYGVLDWGWVMLLGVIVLFTASILILLPLIGYFTVVYLTSFGLLLIGLGNIIISLKLKRIKSLTIDKVSTLKKNIKKAFNNLQEEVIQNYNELNSEEKQRIDEAFENYENNIK